jgi:hypothetical protein
VTFVTKGIGRVETLAHVIWELGTAAAASLELVGLEVPIFFLEKFRQWILVSKVRDPAL